MKEVRVSKPYELRMIKKLEECVIVMEEEEDMKSEENMTKRLWQVGRIGA